MRNLKPKPKIYRLKQNPAITRKFGLRYHFFSEAHCSAKKAGITIKDPMIVKVPIEEVEAEEKAKEEAEEKTKAKPKEETKDSEALHSLRELRGF